MRRINPLDRLCYEKRPGWGGKKLDLVTKGTVQGSGTHDGQRDFHTFGQDRLMQMQFASISI